MLHKCGVQLYRYSETLLIRPSSGPTSSGLINEVALLLKTLLMQPFMLCAIYDWSVNTGTGYSALHCKAFK